MELTLDLPLIKNMSMVLASFSIEVEQPSRPAIFSISSNRR